ncbi:hypothetical protein BH11PLA2_BH11PLA2_47980 [soil metagenome]
MHCNLAVMTVMFFATSSAFAQKDDWYTKAVKGVETVIEPATAAPGQTVTFRVTVDLNENYHTYPAVQPDTKASNFVNTFTFPEPGNLIFVGSVIDPPKPDVKAEPLLGIKELRTYHGKAVFERKAVVSPKAKAGEAKIELKAFKLSVCDADTCFPPKSLTPAATVTVKGDTVAVEKQFAAEVEKALSGK